ncbi:MAG: NIL domain-containing protein [Candidatus Omnitrophica bacterium]|nr:NIL domain-containing protein [Candidatus Omnitrophota bacterium]
MSLRQITLVFPQDKIKEPVVFLMAKECGVTPNIRRARVTETVGEMTLEIDGTEADLKKAVAFLESHGVKVESASGGTNV